MQLSSSKVGERHPFGQKLSKASVTFKRPAFKITICGDKPLHRFHHIATTISLYKATSSSALTVELFP